MVLPATGTYTLFLDPSSDYTGGLTMTLYDVPSDDFGTMTVDGGPRTVAPAVPGHNAKLAFQAPAGQTLTLSVSGSTIPSSYVSVLRPDGSTLVGRTSVSASGRTLDLTPGSTGTYTILLDPSGDGVGQATLALRTKSAVMPRAALAGSQLNGACRRLVMQKRHVAAHRARRCAQMNGLESAWQGLRALQAEHGVTALAGQALTARGGRPLSNVTLRIEDASTQTDEHGRFLLPYMQPGEHVLLIDGSTASTAGHSYGIFEARVRVADGETTELPYTIWMSEIDRGNARHIPERPEQAISVTTPHIGGLELRIAPGTEIRNDYDDVVTEVGLSQVPVARPPFPLPVGVKVPLYFTIQPGAVYLTEGARLIYPNYTHEKPGTRMDFWNYDPRGKGWYVYGQGTVTPDGKQAVPDPGVRIYEFSGAMISTPSELVPPDGGPTDGGEEDGDPVDLASGLFVYDKTDLMLPDVMPISVGRVYRQMDTRRRAFGIGSTHAYEMFLYWRSQYEDVEVILPSGERVKYLRTSGGTSNTDAVLESTSKPGPFFGSKITWNGTGWDLALANGTSYVFTNNRLVAIRDRNGNEVSVARSSDSSRRVTRVTSPHGRWIKFGYDGAGNITTAEDSTGRTVTYVYDTSNRLTSVTDPAGKTTTYTYDSSHRMTSVTDARGITFLKNAYDSNGRVYRQTQADGSTYTFSYVVSSGIVLQTTVTDPRGIMRRTYFGGTGYSVKDTFAVGRSEERVVTYERQPGTNLLKRATDASGRATAYEYDAAGNVTSVTRLAGTVNAKSTAFTYDERFNQMKSVTDPLGKTSSFAYDANGNLTSITDPTGLRTTLEHNARGQTTAVTDPASNKVTFTYDGGDLAAITDPRGNATSHFTDSAGRVSVVTDALGNSTRRDYDVMNQTTRMTDAHGNVTKFERDPNGNVLSVTDAKNHTTSYAFDLMDRLTTRTDPLGRTESFVYDLNGNLTKLTDRKGDVSTFTYDGLNRQTQASYGVVDGAAASSVSYTYDSAGRLTDVADTATGSISLAYNGLDRVTSETTPSGSVSYTYDGAGRRASMTVAGAEPVRYAYDDAGRLQTIARGTGVTAFDRDAAGRLKSVTLPNGVRTTYSYAAGSRLSGISYTNGPNPLGDLTYEHDARGRVAMVGGSFARTELPAAVADTTYDAGNRVTTWGQKTLTYDANGNMTSNGPVQYGWNERGQLGSVSGETTASFAYDAFGRRIRKTIDGVTTRYVFDGATPVQELTASGAVSANLLTGGGVDAYLAQTDSEGTQYFLSDMLGSTVGLTDSSGALQTDYTYGAFGKTSSSGASSANSFKFTGREDDGTGLYYYRARYYSPTLGRFVSEDPLGFAAGDVNLYSYVGNSPTNGIDPMGTCGADAVVDAGFILWDLWGLFTGRKGAGTDLLLDAAGLLIPCATGLSAAAKGLRYADEVIAYGDDVAAHADEAVSYADEGASAISCGNSFARGTKVLMANGKKVPIEKIRKGDRVAAARPKAPARLHSRRVVGLIRHDDADLYRLRIDGTRLTATGKHPFWVAGRGWTDVEDLRAGMKVVLADGTTAGIDETVKLERPAVRVYNFEVAGLHTYFVGRSAVLVHNCPKGPIPDQAPRNLPEQLAMGEAKGGAGDVIMTNLADAPRLKAVYGDGKWVKMQHVHRNPDGTKTVIHYFRNQTTGQNVEFKFK
jgi:RHS repeat-associated protein